MANTGISCEAHEKLLKKDSPTDEDYAAMGRHMRECPIHARKKEDPAREESPPEPAPSPPPSSPPPPSDGVEEMLAELDKDGSDKPSDER